MSASAAEKEAWMEQWRVAGAELDRIWKAELRALTPERALAASDALLALPVPPDVRERRRVYSGLVEQQRLLHARRR